MKTISKPMFNLAERLCDLLDEIHKCFKPGAIATIIVRNPMVDDGDVVMGNDDPDKVIQAINRLKVRPAFVEAGEKVVPQ